MQIWYQFHKLFEVVAGEDVEIYIFKASSSILLKPTVRFLSENSPAWNAL